MDGTSAPLVLSADDYNFIPFAEKFGAPTPLRRTLSLMKLLGCRTILYEKREWGPCEPDRYCGERFRSCKEYIDILKSNKYPSSFNKKTCHKLYFFNESFLNLDQLELMQNSNLLGYCIVHNDTLTHKTKGSMKHNYLTETILVNPTRDGRGSLFGGLELLVRIHKKKFKIKGNYFSQQNSITNCCAHAAIKMAIRGYFPSITAEKINKEIGLDHSSQKGYEGLKPRQISQAINGLSKLEAYSFQSTDFESPLEFLKSVYYSLESKLPVILLFYLPTKAEEELKPKGHAVTLTGYTLNRHNWWSYALRKYFAKGDEAPYLPSFLWCDNFIIQDDNFGPYYYIPIRFLTDFTGLGWTLSAIQSTVKSITSFDIRSLSNIWLNKPMAAIAICPHELSFLKHTPVAELVAMRKLNEYIYHLKKIRSKILEDKILKQYFLDYHDNRSLILRSFVIFKREYIDSIKGQNVSKYINAIDSHLPDQVWVTEISIPELFWIDRKKVGEIISIPNGKEKPKEAESPVARAVFIRLPNNACFYDGSNLRSVSFEPDTELYNLIVPIGLRRNGLRPNK